MGHPHRPYADLLPFLIHHGARLNAKAEWKSTHQDDGSASPLVQNGGEGRIIFPQYRPSKLLISLGRTLSGQLCDFPADRLHYHRAMLLRHWIASARDTLQRAAPIILRLKRKQRFDRRRADPYRAIGARGHPALVADGEGRLL